MKATKERMIVGRSLKRFFKVQVQRIRMSPINKKVNLEASTSTFLSLCGLHTDEMRHDSSRLGLGLGLGLGVGPLCLTRTCRVA